MATLTNVGKTRTLNAWLHGDALSAPAQWYVALYTTVQDVAQTGTECTDAAYARQPIDFNAESGGASDSDDVILFGPFAAPQVIYAVGLCDDIAAGDCIMFINLLATAGFSAGESARIGAHNAIVGAV